MEQLASSLALGTGSNIPIILLATTMKAGREKIQVQDSNINLVTHSFMIEGSNMDIDKILTPRDSKKTSGHSSDNEQYGSIPITKKPDPFNPNTSQNVGSYEETH